MSFCLNRKVFYPNNFSILSRKKEMRASNFCREPANENKQFKEKKVDIYFKLEQTKILRVTL